MEIFGMSPESFRITSRLFIGADESKLITSAITGTPCSPTSVFQVKVLTSLIPKKFGKNMGVGLDLNRPSRLAWFTNDKILLSIVVVCLH